ncbi:hypothetical protein ACFZDG_35625 [Kitasatospora xanthocidica]|uniref:hypothetical protein n=1 Tax=Kitasatospora xanthocidica TaxID=83382 RepID=UPI0036EB2A40
MTTATFTSRSAADRMLDLLYVIAEVVWAYRGPLLGRAQLAVGLAGPAWLAGINPGPLGRLLAALGVVAVIALDTAVHAYRHHQAAAAAATPHTASARQSSSPRSAR